MSIGAFQSAKMAWAIARKDLLLELRTKSIVGTTAYFAALVCILAAIALRVSAARAPDLAPGVLWIATAFSGVMAVARSWGREREMDAIRALLTISGSRSAIFLGKSISSFVFLAAIQLVLVPLVAIFFHLPAAQLLPLSGILLLGVLGFACAGTLFGALTAQSSAREMTVTIVVFPLIAPALLCGAAASRELIQGARWSELLGWLQLLSAYDLLILAAGYLLFDLMISD